ncbi:hypothetical protein Taro_008575, partial [Colocasia esculenta]|nr:hypothetical protein [Colocasia esculenta]
MEAAAAAAVAAAAEAPLMKGLSRQHSAGSITRSGRVTLRRQTSLDPRGLSRRFTFGRQSSMDPTRRSTVLEELTVPENLDSTMQLLFLACKGDVKGAEDLLKEGVDVNSIDLDGRTALHIAACEGQIEVAKLLLSRKANIDARDRWGSTAAADAKYYGHMEVYSLLRARGASVPGVYQVAKWNGTKVAVKILDKECYADLESMYNPELVVHGGARNILLDTGGQLKVAGFGLTQMSQVSPDKAKLAHPAAMLDSPSPYMAPEVYKNEVFDRSIDAFSFGFILFEQSQHISVCFILHVVSQMMEGAPAFHPKSPEDAAKMICSEGMRPPFKCKSKSYPPDLKELIEECWDPEPVVRPTFSEIIYMQLVLSNNGGRIISSYHGSKGQLVSSHPQQEVLQRRTWQGFQKFCNEEQIQIRRKTKKVVGGGSSSFCTMCLCLQSLIALLCHCKRYCTSSGEGVCLFPRSSNSSTFDLIWLAQIRLM